MIYFSGASCEPDKAQLTTFLQKTFVSSKHNKNYKLNIMSSDHVAGSSQAGVHTKRTKKARVIVFGQSFEKDLRVAQSLVREGYAVLLLTPDHTHVAVDDDNIDNILTADDLCVVSMSQISEDVFLFVNNLLELSFYEEDSTIKTPPPDYSLAQEVSEVS